MWNAFRIQRRCLMDKWRWDNNLPIVYFSAVSTILNNFAPTIISLILFSTNIRPCIMILLILVLFTWNLLFHLPGKYLLTLYSLDQASTPLGTLPSSPSLGMQMLCIGSVIQLAFIKHLWCPYARSRKAVVERHAVHCAGSSWILTGVAGKRLMNKNQPKIKERCCTITGEENKPEVLKELWA